MKPFVEPRSIEWQVRGVIFFLGFGLGSIVFVGAGVMLGMALS